MNACVCSTRVTVLAMTDRVPSSIPQRQIKKEQFPLTTHSKCQSLSAYVPSILPSLPPQMTRSLGSGFELVELQQPHVPGHCGLECPPLVLQLSPTGGGGGGGERGSVGSIDEHDYASASSSAPSSSSSVGGERELPPEDAWRDGVCGCFRGFGAWE